MFKFLTRQNNTHELNKSQPSHHVAPGTQIHYIPDLVDNLKNDHIHLFMVYNWFGN